MHENFDHQIPTQSNSISLTSDTSRTSDQPPGRIRITEAIARRQWNELVTEAADATPFHLYEFLETLADHTDTTFHSFVGVDAGQPIGLFPAFERSVGPITTLFSPAPNCTVRYLGPVFLSDRLADAHGRVRRRTEFVEAALACFETRFSPQYMLVRTTDRFCDHRPFVWNDFESTLQYSYVVDLTPDEEALLDSFSSEARSNIRSAAEDISITEEGPEAIAPIIEQLVARHEQQGMSYAVRPEFVTELHERLPAGTVQPYVVRDGRSIIGGMITLYDNNTVYRWQGGAEPDTDVPVNEFLDWHIMQTASERGCSRYDLVGANRTTDSRYKARFDPELVRFHSLVRSSTTMEMFARVHRRLR